MPLGIAMVYCTSAIAEYIELNSTDEAVIRRAGRRSKVRCPGHVCDFKADCKVVPRCARSDS